jgi:hypothetical protein
VDLLEAMRLLGAALAGEAVINNRFTDFTDVTRIHHAQVGAALLALGLGIPELKKLLE